MQNGGPHSAALCFEKRRVQNDSFERRMQHEFIDWSACWSRSTSEGWWWWLPCLWIAGANELWEDIGAFLRDGKRSSRRRLLALMSLAHNGQVWQLQLPSMCRWSLKRSSKTGVSWRAWSVECWGFARWEEGKTSRWEGGYFRAKTGWVWWTQRWNGCGSKITAQIILWQALWRRLLCLEELVVLQRQLENNRSDPSFEGYGWHGQWRARHAGGCRLGWCCHRQDHEGHEELILLSGCKSIKSTASGLRMVTSHLGRARRVARVRWIP